MSYQVAALMNIQASKRARVFRKRVNFLEEYDDGDFRRRFRFTKSSFISICELIEEDIIHDTKRNHSLSPETQLMITLRYLATGDKFRTIGDSMGVHISSVSRCVASVTEALCKHLGTFVHFPNDEDSMNQEKHKFYQVANFPGVVGCIDCTHVRILAPQGDEEPHYINRKGYHSINVQAICDSKMHFLNVVADWPGATHDSRILRSSKIGFEYASGERSGLLLGDGGYACTNWLLTPVLFPRNEAERKYNEAHAVTRSVVERSFGVLKKRFGVLHCEIRLCPKKACKVIGACFILHNMALNFGEKSEANGINEEARELEVPTSEHETGQGLTYRRHFIQQNFS